MNFYLIGETVYSGNDQITTQYGDKILLCGFRQGMFVLSSEEERDQEAPAAALLLESSEKFYQAVLSNPQFLNALCNWSIVLSSLSTLLIEHDSHSESATNTTTSAFIQNVDKFFQCLEQYLLGDSIQDPAIRASLLRSLGIIIPHLNTMTQQPQFKLTPRYSNVLSKLRKHIHPTNNNNNNINTTNGDDSLMSLEEGELSSVLKSLSSKKQSQQRQQQQQQQIIHYTADYRSSDSLTLSAFQVITAIKENDGLGKVK